MPIWVARTPTRTPDRHGHALARHGHARTVARARVRTSRARAAAAASTRQVVFGHQTVRQQNNTKGSRPWAARPRQTRAPMCFSRRGQCGARARRLVRAARGVQRAQQRAARALFPILRAARALFPILRFFPIFRRALSREFSAQKIFNNNEKYWDCSSNKQQLSLSRGLTDLTRLQVHELRRPHAALPSCTRRVGNPCTPTVIAYNSVIENSE
jgi:hypothetical protein